MKLVLLNTPEHPNKCPECKTYNLNHYSKLGGSSTSGIYYQRGVRWKCLNCNAEFGDPDMDKEIEERNRAIDAVYAVRETGGKEVSALQKKINVVCLSLKHIETLNGTFVLKEAIKQFANVAEVTEDKDDN